MLILNITDAGILTRADLSMVDLVDVFETSRAGRRAGTMSAGVDVVLDMEDGKLSGQGSRESFGSFGETSPSVGGGASVVVRLHRWLGKYLGKFQGNPAQSPTRGHGLGFCLWTMAGTYVAFLAICALEHLFRYNIVWAGGSDGGAGRSDGGNYWPVVLINSMAAVAGMLFAAPTSPLIQPRMILGGHVIAASCACAIDYLSSPTRGLGVVPRWVATPLAPAVATFIQSKVGLLHPPSCAAAVIFMEACKCPPALPPMQLSMHTRRML